MRDGLKGTKMNWKHVLFGGGLLILLRHIGFALGFAAQVVAEGFSDGVKARQAVSKSAGSITPGMVVREIENEVQELRSR